MENTRWLIIIKHKQSARIKCMQILFIQTVRSVKTTAYDQNNNMQ